MDCIGFETLTVTNVAIGFANIPGTLRAGPITQSTGSGLNDLTIDASSFTGKKAYNYQIVVDDDASDPETVKWSDDGGSTFKKTGVAMVAGTPVTLNRGLTFTFAAKTGHTEDDVFDFTVYPDGLIPVPEKARCVLETADIRSREDGTDPTATVGRLHKTQVTEDDFFDIIGINNIKKVRFFRDGGTPGVLDIHYYR